MQSHFQEFINAVLMCITLSTVLHGSVIRIPTIQNPCKIDPSSSGDSTFENTSNHMKNIIVAARAAVDQSESLKALIKRNMVEAVMTRWDSPEANVPGVPLPRDEPAMTRSNNVTLFKEDYAGISIYILHLQHAGTLVDSGNKSYIVHIKEIERLFYNWLCTVDTILRSFNSPVSEFINSTVVTIKSPTHSQYRLRYFYVLAKNAKDFINSKNKKYIQFLETLKV